MAQTVQKIDLKKELKALYGAASATPVVVDVPKLSWRCGKARAAQD